MASPAEAVGVDVFSIGTATAPSSELSGAGLPSTWVAVQPFERCSDRNHQSAPVLSAANMFNGLSGQRPIQLWALGNSGTTISEPVIWWPAGCAPRDIQSLHDAGICVPSAAVVASTQMRM